MKYAIVNSTGVVEIRSDNRNVVPPCGVELTNEQYDSICSGAFIVSGSLVVPNPATPTFP